MWRSLLAGSVSHRAAQLKKRFFRIFIFVMDEESRSKRSHRPVKYRSLHKFRGRRRKSKPKTRPTASASAAARPSDSDAASSDEFAAALEYVSASQKKIGLFDDEERPRDEESSLITDLTALNILVIGAVCPTCHRSEMRVREPADKRKGLASFLELRCENSECPESVLSATYTSRRVASSGEASVSAAGDGPSASRPTTAGARVIASL